MQHTWKNKLYCALYATIAPEIFLRKAFNQFWDSRLICLELIKLGFERAEQGVSPGHHTVVPPANSLQRHYTNLGARICGLWHIVCEPWRIVCRVWYMVFLPELEHGFYIEMGGLQLVSDLAGGHDLPSDFKGILTSRGGIELARIGLLPKVPSELIASDILPKILICLQAGWMVIQCIARVAQSLPLTLLELHTLIQTIYAIFMYLLWFKKPDTLKVPTRVRVDDEKLKILKDIVDMWSPLDEGGSRSFRLTKPEDARPTEVNESGFGQEWLPRRRLLLPKLHWLLSPIYGGLHLTMWKGHFPSKLERILWIASALIIVGVPFLRIAGDFLLKSMRGQDGTGWNAPWNGSETYLASLKSQRQWGQFVLYQVLCTLWGIVLGIWVLARIYLVVESFASLRNLPLGAYNNVRWVSFIPHF